LRLYNLKWSSGGILIKQSKIPEIDKFEDIVSELGRRGIVVLMNRSTRWGYVVDAVIPSEKTVILKMPDMNRQTKVAISTFRDMTGRLEGDGYRVLVVPKRSMSQEQIKAFCDRVSGESSLAVA
jgi:hypothetical protein